MSFRFATQKLTTGLYEPEGIYLQTPFAGNAMIGQAWGEHAESYGEFHYNGIPLKGHNGIDFVIPAQDRILATDRGRVVEIGIERGGYERYLKLEHRWGESFYAFLGEILVESGQHVDRGAVLATAGGIHDEMHFFHFAIRIEPFNRLDGFGGFSDPLPYMNPADILFAEDSPESSQSATSQSVTPLHKMLIEKVQARRP